MHHLQWSLISMIRYLVLLSALAGQTTSSSLASVWKRADDEIPPSPPWVFPDTILPKPSCMSSSPVATCPYQGYTSGQTCSAIKCTMAFFGACMQRATLVDKSCLCAEGLNEQGCTDCAGTRERREYLSWLNNTCSDIKGWNGLSLDWYNKLPKVQLVCVGNTTKYSGTITYDPVYNPANRTMCNGYASFWLPNLYNGTEAALATSNDPVKSYSPWYKQSPSYYNPDSDLGYYLDLNGFCGSIYPYNKTVCSTEVSHSNLVLWASSFCNPPASYGWPENWASTLQMFNSSFIESYQWPEIPTLAGRNNTCTSFFKKRLDDCTSDRCLGTKCERIVESISPTCFCKDLSLPSRCNPDELERTVNNLYLNKTCASVSGFEGLPPGWQSSLVVMDSSYGAPGNFTKWPGCANANNCSTTLNRTLTDCGETRCVVNPKTNLCNSTAIGVKPECYCSPVSYEKTCNTECKLSWEREEYLNWMNSTCTPAREWHGLPNNWTDLLLIQDSELLPWGWRIQITSGVAPSPNNTITFMESRHCPSVASKLGAFAAVNVAMALLTPLLGRRDVIRSITRKRLGHRGSSMWLLTGPLTVLLHVASNAVAASIIKKTPGFENVDVGQLILLWCTRPRLVWIVVALIPFQAENEIYFSVASSTLLAEICLQAVGAYYMGIATNYARRQKFYNANRLTKTQKGRDAMIMYAGSIMWLSVIFFAVLICIGSLLGMSRFVAALASAIRGLDRKAKRHRKRAVSQDALVTQKIGEFPNIRSRSLDLEFTFPNLQDEWTEVSSACQQIIKGMVEQWKRLETYVIDDMKQMRKAERTERSLKKKMKPAEKAEFHNHIDQAVSAELISISATWYETPALQSLEINEVDEKIKPHTVWIKDRIAEVDADVTRTMQELYSHQQRLRIINAKIACLDKTVGVYRSWDDQTGRRYGLTRAPTESEFMDRVLYAMISGTPPGFTAVENDYPSPGERNIIRGFLQNGQPLHVQRSRLIGSNSWNQRSNFNSKIPLEAMIARLDTQIRAADDIISGLRHLLASCDYVTSECTMLTRIWAEQRTKRDSEKAVKEGGNIAVLKKIAIRTIIGMLGCWIAQWVWWIGYVRVSDNAYCPPKLGKITAIWIFFSVFGAMVGSSL